MKKIERKSHKINAKGRILGDLAVEIANLLRGKKKVDFVRNQDIGDFVVVENASLIKVTGRKKEQKVYHRHSGYIGGLKTETYKNLIKENPGFILSHAVSGMLPKNKLKTLWLKRLTIFDKEENDAKKD